MPNYYAHFKFGDLVLAQLPQALGKELVQEKGAFDLGCLGPDPLFFYRPWSVCNQPRAEALGMHQAPGAPVLARLQRAMAAGDGAVRAYAAGFLCHYALDAACHGYVLGVAAEGRYSHRQLEAGFDRRLMDLDGYRTPRLAGFPPAQKGLRVYTAGAAAYEHADAKALRAGYRAMSLNARLLARLCGKGSDAASQKLHALMEHAVEDTAVQLEYFLHGEPPGNWYQRTFYGAPGP